MSDLDADLYGDLYDTDLTTRPQEEKVPLDTKAPVTTKSTEPAKKPVPTLIETTPTQLPVYDAQTQQTQQIPTYEEPQAAEYRDSFAPRALDGGGGGGFSGVEGSIRPSKMKDEGKMFIGGLHWDTTDDTLRDYFSQFGKVDACTIMRDPSGRSRCFAFLTFEDPASVDAAATVKEHYLDGKLIDPKRAVPRQEHQRATKLFIGGLAGSVTSDSMRDFFSQFGKVVDSTVMLDRETGRSKGFGFISLENADVSPFLGFGNLEIDGKLIDVKLAQPRYQRDAGGFSEDAQSQGVVGNSTNFNSAPAAAAATGFNTVGGMTGGGVGNAAFDPQALAALYTRMFQMAGGGGGAGGVMNMGNPMMGGMGGMGMGMGGMGTMGMGMGMGMGGPGMGGRMGRGGGNANANGNIPRGPRGGPNGPAGVGPQRTAQRGHGYHPYGRS